MPTISFVAALAAFLHHRLIGQGIPQRQRAVRPARLERFLQRKHGPLPPQFAQVHADLVFDALRGVGRKAHPALRPEGIDRLDEPHRADADKVVGAARGGIVFLDHMRDQAQVVADEPVARGRIARLQRGEGGLLLRRAQRLREAAAFQPQRQVQHLRARRLHKHAEYTKHSPHPLRHYMHTGVGAEVFTRRLHPAGHARRRAGA